MNRPLPSYLVVVPPSGRYRRPKKIDPRAEYERKVRAVEEAYRQVLKVSFIANGTRILINSDRDPEAAHQKTEKLVSQAHAAAEMLRKLKKLFPE